MWMGYGKYPATNKTLQLSNYGGRLYRIRCIVACHARVTFIYSQSFLAKKAIVHWRLVTQIIILVSNLNTSCSEQFITVCLINLLYTYFCCKAGNNHIIKIIIVDQLRAGKCVANERYCATFFNDITNLAIVNHSLFALESIFATFILESIVCFNFTISSV
jgi:hypothetical protein